MAITIAENIIYKAFNPKNPISIMVKVMFAQGLARRKATTAGFDAPFLCNWIARANIPCEQALMKNPKTTELKIERLPGFASMYDIYSRGT